MRDLRGVLENVLGKGGGTISQPIANKLVTSTENLRGDDLILSEVQIPAPWKPDWVLELQGGETPQRVGTSGLFPPISL